MATNILKSATSTSAPPTTASGATSVFSPAKPTNTGQTYGPQKPPVQGPQPNATATTPPINSSSTVTTSQAGKDRMTAAQGVLSSIDNKPNITPSEDENRKALENMRKAVGDLKNTLTNEGESATSTFDDRENLLKKTQAELAALQAEKESGYEEYKKNLENLKHGLIPLTADQQAQIDGLQSVYNQAVQKQIRYNQNYTGGVTQLGISQGLSRYAPEQAFGQIQQAVSEGIDRVNDIERQGASAIAQIRAGFQSQNFELANEGYKAYQEFLKDKESAINSSYAKTSELYKDMQQQEQKRQDAQFQLGTNLDQASPATQEYFAEQIKKYPSVIGIAQEQGIPVEQLSSINGATIIQLIKSTPEYQLEQQQKISGLMQVVDINGTDVLINKATGQVVKSFGGTGTGGGAITNTTPGAAEALKVILGSGKFTKDQATAVTRAINSGENPLTVIKNLVKSSLPAAASNDLTNLEVATASLEDLNASLQQFYNEGGKTGIFSGNLESTLNKLGKVNDPKLVNIAVQIATAIQEYRHAVSGTAYSVQEGQQIDSVFPGINKGQGLNNAIISGRLNAMNNKIDNTYSNFLGSSVYTNLKSSTASVRMLGPDGKTYDVPQESVESFKADGGKLL